MDEQTSNASEQAGGELLLDSGPRLTIENAGEFAQRISAGLAAGQDVALSFAPDVELDITVLQILCSACKTAASQGRTIALRGQRPAALDALVEACGARQETCKQHNDTICTWFGEEK
ncbi:MAG: STAS domain-containing protein [Thermodesulfobacteriota bacterium]